MSTSTEFIKVSSFEVEVVRKPIKNMHLAVYPPTGRIRLSAPSNANSEVIRLFAISKIGWIKKHIKNFNRQSREMPREYITGESHYFKGNRYLLKVVETDSHGKVEIIGPRRMVLHTKGGASWEEKSRVMKKWYRKQLKAQLPQLIEKWEKIVGVQCNSWGVKLMKTKWGACNIEEKRIWINLELAKKPMVCLEYIIAHELVHLLERNHNDRFVSYLNQFMPNWRTYREELNNLPLASPAIPLPEVITQHPNSDAGFNPKG